MDVVLMGRYGRLGLIKRPTRADREIARSCLDR
jgi:manganese/zinc/iron transport system ATP- binding protein